MKPDFITQEPSVTCVLLLLHIFLAIDAELKFRRIQRPVLSIKVPAGSVRH